MLRVQVKFASRLISYIYVVVVLVVVVLCAVLRHNLLLSQKRLLDHN